MVCVIYLGHVTHDLFEPNNRIAPYHQKYGICHTNFSSSSSGRRPRHREGGRGPVNQPVREDEVIRDGVESIKQVVQEIYGLHRLLPWCDGVL